MRFNRLVLARPWPRCLSPNAKGFQRLGMRLCTLALSSFCTLGWGVSLDDARITKIYPNKVEKRVVAATTPSADFSGLEQRDLLSHIYHQRYAMANVSGLQGAAYLGQMVSGLANQCPRLDLVLAQFEMMPYFLTAATDTVLKVLAGRGSREENSQVLWGSLLMMHQNQQCQYQPGRESRAVAQQRCNDSAQDGKELMQPSLAGRRDFDLWMSRYPCDSPQTQQLSASIVAFARRAHRQVRLQGSVPDLDSPQGQLYGEIFSNCSRSAPDNRNDEWCACYVRRLSSMNPSAAILRKLALNPFVEGSIIQGLMQELPAARDLVYCADEAPTFSGRDAGMAPRDTACLIGQSAAGNGKRACHYRSAWSEFTLKSKTCAAEFTSNQWGYREVDCDRDGRELQPQAHKPRIWSDTGFNYIDYEAPVSDDFQPEVPKDAAERAPLAIRFLKRDTPGALRHMQLVKPGWAEMSILGVPFMNPPEAIGHDLVAISEQGGLLMECAYVTAHKSVNARYFWYQKVPRHIRSGTVSSEGAPYFKKIQGPATACPTTPP